MMPPGPRPRKKLVAGNWKMNTNRATAVQLAGAVVRGVGPSDRGVTVAVCPPFPYLAYVAEIIRGTPVGLGGQDCYFEREGAFTGEVSPAMLQDVGCKYVIVGHSERRHKLGEDDALINRKARAGLGTGLTVILCVGETLEQREAGQTEAVLDAQVTAGLAGVTAEALRKLVLAYEPVWAIGTGRNATPEQAQEAHAYLRRRVGQLLGEELARGLRIQYGGSVTPENAAALLSQPDVDGALIGGASLSADKFLAIARAAAGG
jgi:triosephosphate isomerase